MNLFYLDSEDSQNSGIWDYEFSEKTLENEKLFTSLLAGKYRLKTP